MARGQSGALEITPAENEGLGLRWRSRRLGTMKGRFDRSALCHVRHIQVGSIIAPVVPVMMVMPAMPMTMPADAARTVRGVDDPAAPRIRGVIGRIVRRVVAAMEVTVMVDEPEAAAMMESTMMEAAAMERGSGVETAAVETAAASMERVTTAAVEAAAVAATTMAAAHFGHQSL